MQPGDLYLLCTDGLTGVLDDTVIADIARRFRGPHQSRRRRLLELALRAAAHDNVTLVLARPVELLK